MAIVWSLKIFPLIKIRAIISIALISLRQMWIQILVIWTWIILMPEKGVLKLAIVYLQISMIINKDFLHKTLIDITSLNWNMNKKNLREASFIRNSSIFRNRFKVPAKVIMIPCRNLNKLKLMTDQIYLMKITVQCFKAPSPR